MYSVLSDPLSEVYITPLGVKFLHHHACQLKWCHVPCHNLKLAVLSHTEVRCSLFETFKTPMITMLHYILRFLVSARWNFVKLNICVILLWLVTRWFHLTEALAHRLTRNDCSTKVGLHVVLRCFCQNRSGGEIRKISFILLVKPHCSHRDMFRMRMSEPLHQR